MLFDGVGGVASIVFDDELFSAFVVKASFRTLGARTVAAGGGVLHNLRSE